MRHALAAFAVFGLLCAPAAQGQEVALRGRAVDAAGTPLAEARFTLWQVLSDASGRIPAAWGTSDAAGRFLIASPEGGDLPDGRYTLETYLDDHQVRRLAVSVSGAPIDLGDVRLARNLRGVTLHAVRSGNRISWEVRWKGARRMPEGTSVVTKVSLPFANQSFGELWIPQPRTGGAWLNSLVLPSSLPKGEYACGYVQITLDADPFIAPSPLGEHNFCVLVGSTAPPVITGND